MKNLLVAIATPVILFITLVATIIDAIKCGIKHRGKR